jgi:SAM-dependent methyltransferase
MVLRQQKAMAAIAVLLAMGCGYFLYVQVSEDLKDARIIVRNFYGSLRTTDTVNAGSAVTVRELYHGTIRHGEQHLGSARSNEPTTYYGTASGIGLAMAQSQAQGRRVGLIGLGTGTLAAYGRDGDVFRFYEINPQVIEIAHNEFTYLRNSKARIETVLGDARLALEKEPAQQFDVLAVDAFSGDAIPVHLVTREALAVYLRHMKPDGIIAFHVTNKFLALAPVVKSLAADQGLSWALISDEGIGTTAHSTDWMLLARDARRLDHPKINAAVSDVEDIPELGVWTDDFNNLFDVMK